jgi:hypothetical protein
MNAGATKPVAVVHLVRKVNGLAVLKDFIAAYREHEAGIEHDLVCVFKGYADAGEMAPYKEVLQDVCTRILDIPDSGYDITAYWMAAEAFEHPYFCFLNSFSRIMADGWLEKLHRAVARGSVGLAGATGSYQSFRPSSFKTFMEISRESKHRGPLKDALMALPFSHHVNYVRHKLLFGPGYHNFPNYHIRTNAFVLSGDFMRKAFRRPITTKMDAYDFESGRHNLTMQLLEGGFNPVVVGMDGTTYHKEDWHRSDTFWQAKQENLLVADNQTRHYTEGPPQVRSLLSRMAWEDLARPS